MPMTGPRDKPLSELGPVAEQFEEIEQQRASNLLGMWLFLATELLLFGGIFASFVVYRFLYPQGFIEASNLLSLPTGVFNTAVLLTSGLTMVLTEHSLNAGRRRAALLFLLSTLALGAVFLGIKAMEWHHEYQEGLMPVFNLAFDHTGEHARQVRLFFNFYFSLTGLHVFHMLIGVGLLGIIVVFILRWRDPPRIARQVQITALYWAFVDVLWVIIFTLLYVLRI
ncbi:cytochrome c oxidase subunit 3 [Litchfieldella rifensis]|uniref:Heme-copper oxidase subunit III n=1 Tax=Litchfieldella rifensis TaxID=762643 RepID=A0ABV7LMH6_9GAMM